MFLIPNHLEISPFRPPKKTLTPSICEKLAKALSIHGYEVPSIPLCYEAMNSIPQHSEEWRLEGTDLFEPLMHSTKITFIIMSIYVYICHMCFMCIYIYICCYAYVYMNISFCVCIHMHIYKNTAGLTKRSCVFQWIARKLNSTKWQWVLLPEVVDWIGSLCPAGQMQTTTNFREPLNPLIFDPMKTNTFAFNHQRHLPHFIQKKILRNLWKKKQTKKLQTAVFSIKIHIHKSLDFSQAAQSHRTRSAPPVAGRWSFAPQLEMHGWCDIYIYVMWYVMICFIQDIFGIYYIPYAMYLFIIHTYSHHLQQTCSA